MHLINFFYVYSLFVSTDAEMFFYYCIYYKKFDFCQNLFKDEKLFEELKTFFEKYNFIKLILIMTKIRANLALF
jgi:hypothetical protein